MAQGEAMLAEIASARPAASAPASVLPARSTSRRTVGRARECGELRAGFERAAAGHSGLLTVAGEPGIGKTTLVDEFLDDVASSGQPCFVARGRCSERLAGTEAYLPWLEALESLLHGEASDSVARAMRTLAPSWYVQVAPLASDDSSAARLAAEAQAGSQERRKRELAAFLQETTRLRSFHRPDRNRRPDAVVNPQHRFPRRWAPGGYRRPHVSATTRQSKALSASLPKLTRRSWPVALKSNGDVNSKRDTTDSRSGKRRRHSSRHRMIG